MSTLDKPYPGVPGRVVFFKGDEYSYFVTMYAETINDFARRAILEALYNNSLPEDITSIRVDVCGLNDTAHYYRNENRWADNTGKELLLNENWNEKWRESWEQEPSMFLPI